jgi:hypothetical protein
MPRTTPPPQPMNTHLVADIWARLVPLPPRTRVPPFHAFFADLHEYGVRTWTTEQGRRVEMADAFFAVLKALNLAILPPVR